MIRYTSSVLALVLALSHQAIASDSAHEGIPLRISGPISVELEPQDDSDTSTAGDLLQTLRTLPGSFELGSKSPARIERSETTPTAAPATQESDTPETLSASRESTELAEAPATNPEPVSAAEQLPLGQSRSAASFGGGSSGASETGLGSIARTVGATGAVIALILLLRFAFVKLSGTTGGLRAQLGAAGKAPSGVLFVLGRYPISRGMSLVLLQLDQRVLLLSQTGDGFQTLAELTDPDEVASIVRKVRDESGESLTARFSGMLKKFESDPQTIEDLEPASIAQPVRLRYDDPAGEPRGFESAARSEFPEPKTFRTATTGEDELRSRINRLREYGT